MRSQLRWETWWKILNHSGNLKDLRRINKTPNTQSLISLWTLYIRCSVTFVLRVSVTSIRSDRSSPDARGRQWTPAPGCRLAGMEAATCPVIVSLETALLSSVISLVCFLFIYLASSTWQIVGYLGYDITIAIDISMEHLHRFKTIQLTMESQFFCIHQSDHWWNITNYIKNKNYELKRLVKLTKLTTVFGCI